MPMIVNTLPKIARGTSRPGFRTSSPKYMIPSQPSIVNTTACNPRMTATASPHPAGIAGSGVAAAGAAARACPPRTKQATSKIKNAIVFVAAVRICAPLPQRIPRHCKTPNPTMIDTAIIFTCPASIGKRSPLYSAITIPTAAAVPQVESQSLHPTMNPAYSPIARREKLYCPPLRGIAAPSSAKEDAPNSAYSPPTTQTPRKSHVRGKTWAMSPGVRTIPAAIELPIAADTPNHTPRTCSRRPRLRATAGAGVAVLVEDRSDVLDNVESLGRIGNSAIIMAARQNASRKSAFCKTAEGDFSSKWTLTKSEGRKLGGRPRSQNQDGDDHAARCDRRRAARGCLRCDPLPE